MKKHARNNTNAQPRPSVAQLQKRPSHLPTEQGKAGAKPLVSRRGFLFGALGAGAAVALGAAAYGASTTASAGATELNCLSVPQSSLTPLTDLTAWENPQEHANLVASFDVPYGTLVWAGNDSVAACLLPTESGSPLTQVGILYLGSGLQETVVENAVNKSDDFEIYDARATESGVVWTEANIMEATWKIYGAPLENGVLGTPLLLDQGDRTYEMPSLAVSGTTALWQKIPRDTADLEHPSQLLCAAFASGQARVLFESLRRSATPPCVDGTGVVIAPRVDSPTTYHQLTRIDIATGDITDTLTLPASMKPLEAAYGKTGFMFSFPDIYNYGEGISNLGTYVPQKRPADGNYSAVPWFGFTRTPSAAPTWAGDTLIVKSTYSVCGIDLDQGAYFALDVENGADNYGEYLVSTGIGDRFVTCTNIDHSPIGDAAVHTGRVKVWTPL